MKHSLAFTAFTLIAATLLPAASFADPPAAEPGGDVITVIAPRAITDQVRRSVSGTGESVVTIRISVLYGDLDLARPRDSERLMTRIRSAARDACGHLDRLYPLVVDRACVAKAVADATPLAQAAIAKAGK